MTTFRRQIFTAGTAVLLWPAFTLPASAQTAGDDGEYEILEARYGTAERNVDVTERLKELARQDRSFKMENSIIGVDPHKGEKKTLRIYTRGRDGRHRTFEYAEHSVVDGSQFTGWSRGGWGRGGWAGGWGDSNPGRPGSNAGSGYGNSGNSGNSGYGSNEARADDDGDYQILQARYGTAERNIDVTARLKELAREDRRFKLKNSVFGTDPDKGRKKTLRIYARGRNGQMRTFEYAEDGMVDGNQFTGWGGGDWGRGGWQGGWGENRRTTGYSQDEGDRSRSGLVIEYASYGYESRQRDVTQRLRSRLRDGRIDVKVDNDLAGGDPAPRMHKTLWVTYSVDGGRARHAAVNERERLVLP